MEQEICNKRRRQRRHAVNEQRQVSINARRRQQYGERDNSEINERRRDGYAERDNSERNERRRDGYAERDNSERNERRRDGYGSRREKERDPFYIPEKPCFISAKTLQLFLDEMKQELPTSGQRQESSNKMDIKNWVVVVVMVVVVVVDCEEFPSFFRRCWIKKSE